MKLNRPNSGRILGLKLSEILSIIVLAFFLLNAEKAISQVDTTKTSESRIYIIITNDGGEFIGRIIRQDAREVLIDTQDRGEIIIPKYQIKEMRELKPGELSQKGEYIPEEVFSTRYFITTNGLPAEKGESYILWSLWGPDIQFGVGKNTTVGVLTTWFGVPIIGSFKYAIELGDNSNLALGTLLGTGSWASPDFGIALPYAALTFGNRRSNLTFSGGYGAIWGDGESGGRALVSVAAMTKITKSTSLVFDSFIVPNAGGGNIDTGTVALLFPGLRIQTRDKSAFQFGFAGLIADGELLPFPIPAVQWFKKF